MHITKFNAEQAKFLTAALIVMNKLNFDCATPFRHIANGNIGFAS